ncbi:hypothetical protein LPJ67_004137, partial [Coemansia sp. RSA 1938]
GDKDELIYSNLLGPSNNDTVAAAVAVAVPEAAEAELVAGVDAVNLNEEEGESDDDNASDKSEFAEETKEEKKERQKAFKDANRERRKTKVPKFVKKRATRPKK